MACVPIIGRVLQIELAVPGTLFSHHELRMQMDKNCSERLWGQDLGPGKQRPEISWTVAVSGCSSMVPSSWLTSEQR